MNAPGAQRVRVIDSHTGGEPTRLVVSGGPALRGRTMAERRDDFEARHDAFRGAVVNEPRGSDVLVGALLTEPADPTCAAGVIFFNNVGCLGMCGHGLMGVIASLAHLGIIGPGDHRIETPVGVVSARLEPSGTVSVRNVPCERVARGVTVLVPGHGAVTGDVAWGGNWFYLVGDHGLEIAPENVESLTDFAWAARQALAVAGILGRGGRPIDHIELFGPPSTPRADSRNFVLCPGKAYDRSPCGTGTSAKLACLFADGKLKEGEVWRQESITGSIFEGFIQRDGEDLVPTISGRAFVTGEAALILDPEDPFCWGIRCPPSAHTCDG